MIHIECKHQEIIFIEKVIKKNREITVKICDLCGEIIKDIKIMKIEESEKCKHSWECLRDKVHNKGNGKYRAYKCRLCEKFVRRSLK